MKISGVIQAGGRARRMGENKAFLEIGGRTIIDRVIAELRKCTDGVLLIANEPEEYRHLGLEIFPDEIPGKGALGGVYTALVRSPTPFSFITACDMPFLASALVERLAAEADGVDAVVARTDHGFEPFAAVYGRSALTAVKAMIDAGDLAVHHLFERVKTRVVDLDAAFLQRHPHLFFNINTPDDFRAARMFVVDR